MTTEIAEINARYEVWFLGGVAISVFVETGFEDAPGYTAEVVEIAVFASLAAGVIANLPRPLQERLSERLGAVSIPTSDDDIPTSVDGFDLVLPGALDDVLPEQGRRGFEGTCRIKGGPPIGRLKFRGFGRFGAGCDVQDCAQTGTMAVLHDRLGGFSSYGRAGLVAAAHTLGSLGASGMIKMRNHPHSAMAALESGVEAMDETLAEGDPTS